MEPSFGRLQSKTMKKYIYLSVILVLLILLEGCSSTPETSQESAASDSSQVYVFDVVEDDSLNQIGAVKEAMLIESDTSAGDDEFEFFIVQVGAFTTVDRAKRFIDEHKADIDHEMTYHYSDIVKLYVVQLPPFRTRAEAELVRNALWQTDTFKDAFIVPKR